MKKILLYTFVCTSILPIFAMVDGQPIVPLPIKMSRTKAKPAPAEILTTGADAMINFKNMALQHKMDWMDFKRDHADAEINLIEKNHKEWVTLTNDQIKEWSTNTNWAQDARDAIAYKHVRQDIALYKQHQQEWRSLCDKRTEEGNAIYERHQQELAQFEKTINQVIK